MSTDLHYIRAHISYLLTGQLVNGALRFGATILLSRALSVGQFGLVNVGIALSGVALIVTSLGLPELGSREVAVAQADAGWIAGRILLTRIVVLGSVSAAGIPLGALLWPGHTVLLCLASCLGLMMAVSGDWLARGLERMMSVAIASASGGMVLLIGSATIALGPASELTALTVFVLAEAVVTAVLWFTVTRVVRPRWGLRGARSMLTRARPLALSAVVIYSYYANLDTILLAATRSEAEAGLYSAPYRLFLMLNLVGILTAYSILPILARKAQSTDPDEGDRLLRSVLSVLSCYGLVVLGLVEISASAALGFLFGSKFEVATGPFLLLAAGVAWYSVGFPAGYSLIALNRYSSFLAGAGTAGALNLILDLVLIPQLGMTGAGIATVVAFTAASLVWLSVRGVLDRRMIPILTMLVSTSVGAVAVAAEPRLSTAIGLFTVASGTILAVIGRTAVPSARRSLP